MKYRLFIVEDDRGISEALIKHAELWGMEAKCVSDYQAVLSEFAEFDPHLVLMDISLPFYNGFHWCREIRRISKVPIVFISSAEDNMNIIMAMNMGADDFIAKPFDMTVLTAKIQALLRRSYDYVESRPVIEHRGAVLDTGDCVLTYNSQQLRLTKNEYRILYVLMKNKGSNVSRESLMEALWQTDCFVDDNTLTVNVNRLRKKLDSVGLNDFITTRFGVGYVIE